MLSNEKVFLTHLFLKKENFQKQVKKKTSKQKMGWIEQWRSRQQIDQGKGARSCKMCGNQKALIRKYGLFTCRQCFRENAENLGFIKTK
jgi:small subunit ribosomal protein S29e